MTEVINGTVVHTNENYEVVVRELGAKLGDVLYTHGYFARNIHTGVLEYGSPSLPDVLHTAEQLNQAIVSEAWKWRREKAEQPKAVSRGLADLVN